MLSWHVLMQFNFIVDQRSTYLLLLAALKALQTVRTSPLVQQCQKVLNDISTRHAVGLYWVPGHAGVRGNEIADDLARGSSALKFVGPEPDLGVSR
jgi:hypothetical protein